MAAPCRLAYAVLVAAVLIAALLVAALLVAALLVAALLVAVELLPLLDSAPTRRSWANVPARRRRLPEALETAGRTQL